MVPQLALPGRMEVCSSAGLVAVTSRKPAVKPLKQFREGHVECVPIRRAV